MLAATACDEVVDAISNSIVFTFSNNTVYDGQTAHLGVVSNAKIGWTVANDSKDIVSLDYNKETGQECVATFTLKDHKAEKNYDVTITTTDLDDAEREPYTGTIHVAPWRLVVYKKNGKDWDLIGESVSFATNGAGTYRAQMEYYDASKAKWTGMTSILYSLSIKKGQHKVLWLSNGKNAGVDVLGDKLAKFSDKCYVEFELSEAPGSSFVVQAFLGKDRDKEGNTLDASAVGTSGMVEHFITVNK